MHHPDPLIIPIVAILMPLFLVPTVLVLKHRHKRREWEHRERMRAMDGPQPFGRPAGWIGSGGVAAIGVLGILSALFIPKFAGEIKTEGGFSLVEFVQAFRSPVVWIAAVSLFFVYFFYTGVTYTTPYMTGILGVSLAAATVVANIRNYGITLLSGPAFGWVANRFKPSIVIAAGSVVFIVALLAMMLLPTSAAVMVIACVLVVLLGFIANGAFSVVSAQLTEGKVPLGYFGAATGLLSIIGFLPDTFSSTWFGSIMDAQTDAAGNVQAGAYHQIFWILVASAVLAAVASLGLYLYLRKVRGKAEVEVPVAATAAA